MTNNPTCEDCDHPQTFCACCATLEDRREYEKEAREQWDREQEIFERLDNDCS